MKISLKALKQVAVTRPEGYYEDVISKGKKDGEYLEIEPAQYRELLQKYQPKLNIVNAFTSSCCGGNNSNQSGSFPPAIEQAKNLAGAIGRVSAAFLGGNKVRASEEEVRKRETICAACEFNKNSRCLKCGCYWKVKMNLETEHCPVNKW